MSAAARHLVNDTFPEDQAQIRRRLDEIWATARSRDLESFHLYGPKFTEFKDGQPRGDAAANRKGEEGGLALLGDPKVDM